MYSVQCTVYSEQFTVQRWALQSAECCRGTDWLSWLQLNLHTAHCTLSHLYSAQYTLHTQNCTVQTVQCTLYTVDIASCALHLTPCQPLASWVTVQCTLYTLHCKLYTVHCTLYIVHYTLYTLRCTLYSVHRTLYNSGLLGDCPPSCSCTFSHPVPHPAACTVYSVQCTIYSIHCTLYTVYTVYCTLYNFNYKPLTCIRTLYTAHFTLLAMCTLWLK